MRYVVVYDIADDGLRTLTSEILKDYGLKRIQKSAFMGNLKKYKLNSMVADLKNKIESDRILVIPLCQTDFENLVKPLFRHLPQEYKKILPWYVTQQYCVARLDQKL